MISLDSVNDGKHVIRDQHTRSSLLYLRHDRKDLKQLHHYLHHDILDRFRRWHFGIILEWFEEIFDSLEDDKEIFLARINVVYRLYDFDIRLLRAREIRDDS